MKHLLLKNIMKKNHAFCGDNFIFNMGYKHLVTHGNFYLALEKERNDKKRKLLTRNQHEIF